MTAASGWRLAVGGLVLAVGLAGPVSRAAGAGPDEAPALCAPLYQMQHPAACPAAGPGGYTARLRQAGLPYPLPQVDFTPARPFGTLTPYAYARVITDTPPVYLNPFEALLNLPPARSFEKGFVYVSLLGAVTVSDTVFYQINPREFMRAADVTEVRPASFSGTYFAAPPGSAVGWVITRAPLSSAPGQPPAPGAAVAGRYQAIQVWETQFVNGWDWYLIGPGQWIEQRNVALVQPAPPPGAPPNVIAVDTYEQSLGVYRNGALVYATLASSGSRAFPTREGIFQIRVKLTHGRMTGAYFDDRRDYYYLEDVPWILYYDGQRGLHGAYWHDNFGIRTSHGCVNLAPRDARWLYDNAQVGDTVMIFSSGQ